MELINSFTALKHDYAIATLHHEICSADKNKFPVKVLLALKLNRFT